MTTPHFSLIQGVKVFAIFAVSLLIASPQLTRAHGEIGDDIKDLQSHLGEYEENLAVVMSNYAGVVDKYVAGESPDTEQLLKFWEDAEMHYAIELNYIPIYAKIWQNIFAIKEGIDSKAPAAQVQGSQQALEQILWQALGAVKMAAKVQAEKAKAAGDTATTEKKEDESLSPVETIAVIQDKLDRVMAKCAERDFEAATEMVHDTYLNLFEGVEGQLIEQDAKLVEDLEKDFNVTLLKVIEKEAPLAEIKGVTEDMKGKLNQASSLLAEAEKKKKDVF